ncbi:DMT family transporter [Puniceibacterium confluentis]|uniref:DMT family transporter n=1 Tax=Puniceibacterium confluentis TaxID=1958944 RepID=UPI0011B54B83|nr:DMT family transporter [Puniceibacterium confluentis]
MTSHPLFGLLLATFGALVLTPDALFMRLSGMDGMQMLGWRGLSMGGLFLLAWFVTTSSRVRDLGILASGAGLAVMLCQALNATLFPTGIALAPVSVVLVSVATTPVWSAVLARLLYGEVTSRATWLTIVAVLFGIAIAVSGKGDAALNTSALLGALCGLGVAFSLALNFVILRNTSRVPILLCIGLGALLAGSFGLLSATPARMMDGTVWAIALTGALILPVSFFSLSLASRHTAATNVSLLMLLETVIGPLWVWLGTGETPTPRMLLGGALVLISLAAYLLGTDRAARRRRSQTV